MLACSLGQLAPAWWPTMLRRIINGEEAMPTVDDLSLRLLRHHASAARHQRYYGVDGVAVQVEGHA